jgi:hypothetical protein
MRKTLLFAFIAMLASFVEAQPILDQTAVGQVGSTFYLGIQDTFAPGFSLGNAGANQTWDFSALLVNDLDTVSFLDPSSTPYGNDFPNANLAVKQASLGDVMAYLVLSSAGLDLVGIAGDVLDMGQTFVLHQNPPARIAQFPFTYLDTYNNVTVIDTTVDASGFGIPLVDSARYKNIQDRDFLADGYGSLELPVGNFTGVLRVKEINHQKDSIWVHSFFGWALYQDSSYTDSTFTWWNGTKGYYLAQAEYEGGSLVSLRYEDPVIVGRPDPRSGAFAVHPNPSTDRVVFETDGKVYDLFIMDMQGRILVQEKLSSSQAEVNMSNLSKGFYMYTLIDQRGRTRITGRLSLID